MPYSPPWACFMGMPHGMPPGLHTFDYIIGFGMHLCPLWPGIVLHLSHSAPTWYIYCSWFHWNALCLSCHPVVHFGGRGSLGISEASRSGFMSGCLGCTEADKRMVSEWKLLIYGMVVVVLFIMGCDSASISNVSPLTNAKVSIWGHLGFFSRGVGCKDLIVGSLLGWCAVRGGSRALSLLPPGSPALNKRWTCGRY